MLDDDRGLAGECGAADKVKQLGGFRCKHWPND
jgi:hypothetical protein